MVEVKSGSHLPAGERKRAQAQWGRGHREHSESPGLAQSPLPPPDGPLGPQRQILL